MQIEITITNWKKYQSISDRTRSPHWFKLHYNIVLSQGLFGLTSGQKWFYVTLLSECCRKNDSKIICTFSWLSHISGTTKKDILEALEILRENGTLTFTCQSTVNALTTEKNRIEENRIEENRREEKRVEKNNIHLADAKMPQKTLGSLCFEAYAEGYEARYKAKPVRNKKINGQFKLLSERLGEDAIEVSRFYLSHNDSFYFRSGHSVDLLLKHAEKLHTEWITGKKISASQIRSAEKKDHYLEQIERVKNGEL